MSRAPSPCPRHSSATITSRTTARIVSSDSTRLNPTSRSVGTWTAETRTWLPASTRSTCSGSARRSTTGRRNSAASSSWWRSASQGRTSTSAGVQVAGGRVRRRHGCILPRKSLPLPARMAARRDRSGRIACGPGTAPYAERCDSRGGPVDDELALLLAAGERAAFHGRPASGVAPLQKAVELARSTDRDAEATAAAWLLGVSLGAAGRYGSALTVLEPVAGHGVDARPERALFAALSSATMASLHRQLGRHDAARVLDQQALTLAGETPGGRVRRAPRPGRRRDRARRPDHRARRAGARDRAHRGTQRLVAAARPPAVGARRARAAHRRPRRRGHRDRHGRPARRGFRRAAPRGQEPALPRRRAGPGR